MQVNPFENGTDYFTSYATCYQFIEFKFVSVHSAFTNPSHTSWDRILVDMDYTFPIILFLEAGYTVHLHHRRLCEGFLNFCSRWKTTTTGPHSVVRQHND